MNKAPRIVLPDRFKAVVGDTLQLFYRGIIEHPFPYIYNIQVVCDIGRNTPRYFEVTPTPDHVGEHTLTVTLRDFDDTVVATSVTVLEVCPQHQTPEVKKNVLCVGDSLTAGGVWCAELCRRLTRKDGTPKGRGLHNVSFIGTCEKDGTRYEGYGGWTWGSYLVGPSEKKTEMVFDCRHDKDISDQHSLWRDSNGGVWKLETIVPQKLVLIRLEPFEKLPEASGRLTHMSNAEHTADIEYTATYKVRYNPFWDTDTLSVNFNSYCQRNGFDGIDVVCTLLTWNGGGGFLDERGRANIATQTDLARKFLRILHSQYPEAKVLMMGLQLPGLNGGCGASYGANDVGMGIYSNTYALCRYVFEMNVAYQALANEEEFSSFVKFVNISAQFDSENNMPEADRPVNLRSTKTEKVGTNGVHPAVEGYYQIADAVYRNISF